MRHLLLTNDFPPKVGGIQSYLWELWRRLPPDDVTVFTASYPGAAWWDGQQKFQVIRAREPVLLPQPFLARRARRAARHAGARAVVIDPAVPLGLVGRSLGSLTLWSCTVQRSRCRGGSLFSRQLLARTIRNAALVIAAGNYPEAEARKAVRHGAKVSEGASAEQFPPVVQIPPGVDTERFHPLPQIDRAAARARLGLPLPGLSW